MEEVYKYLASCPVCGRNLFRGSPKSENKGNCPKCKNELLICYLENGMQITVLHPAALPQDKERKLNMPKR